MNIILRPLNFEDETEIENLRTWRNQDFVREVMTNKHIISKDEHADYMNMRKNDESYKIFLLEINNNVIAVVNIWLKEKGIYEYGYYLINKNDTGKGLGKVMEYYSIEKIFELGAEIIEAMVLDFNDKVIKLHERSGYKIYKLVDREVIMRLDRDTWEVKKYDYYKEAETAAKNYLKNV
ncbi:MAG: GNAT family N-acetyltransferase [Tissierellia bacterium]|nr:GNAT family N-acetyltransferase [Tissierellia bacterium]